MIAQTSQAWRDLRFMLLFSPALGSVAAVRATRRARRDKGGLVEHDRDATPATVPTHGVATHASSDDKADAAVCVGESGEDERSPWQAPSI
jgi:hypothetical protein